MKQRVTLITLAIFTTTSAVATAGTSVRHSHSGRVHSHLLPAQGVSHRHGALDYGVPVEDMQYTGKPRPDLPITRPAYKQRLALGDTNCDLGDTDCNPCADNVQQQFQKAANGNIRWRSKPWRFNWSQPYPPNKLSPLDLFDGEPAHAFGIPDTHVQGFVHTNSTHVPYAGSHSHKLRGGIFVITQLGNGKKYLSTLHQTNSRHPSGVHILGKYLVYAENQQLVFKDLNSPNQQTDIILPIPVRSNLKTEFGGGLGITKLARDEYLLVTTGPGGQDQRPRVSQFYRLDSVNGRPHHLTFINQSQMINPNQWPNQYRYSENLSLITECHSGDIYAIHTSGDEKGIKAINGYGYWHLSRLMQQQNKLIFKPVSAFASRQNMTSCNVRAAATAYVTPRHQIELYCHGYAKDPSGSAFNILGQSNSRADKFYFRVGTIH